MNKKEYNLTCENRTETQRKFHRDRVAFLIYKSKIYYLKDVDKSHFELASELGISKEEFDNLCRGFYFNNRVVFYKGHFIYDEDIIATAKKFIAKIKRHCDCKEKVEVYCGQKIGDPNTIWPPDYYLGEF